jgi:hypothetical protein
MKMFQFLSVLAGLCLILSLGSGMVQAQSLQEKADANKDKDVI